MSSAARGGMANGVRTGVSVAVAVRCHTTSTSSQQDAPHLTRAEPRSQTLVLALEHGIEQGEEDGGVAGDRDVGLRARRATR